jgi:hypothetical protein
MVSFRMLVLAALLCVFAVTMGRPVPEPAGYIVHALNASVFITASQPPCANGKMVPTAAAATHIIYQHHTRLCKSTHLPHYISFVISMISYTLTRALRTN